MQYKNLAGQVHVLNPSTSTVQAEVGIIRLVSIVRFFFFFLEKGLFNTNSIKAEVSILPNANDMPDIGIRVGSS